MPGNGQGSIQTQHLLPSPPVALDLSDSLPFLLCRFQVNDDDKAATEIFNSLTSYIFFDFRGSDPFPMKKALNFTKVSISKQTKNDRPQSYTDDDAFESWMSRQTELKENVRKVCDKYRKSLSCNVPLNQFMYDSKHKLLFCRNAKVNVATIAIDFPFN